MVRVDDLVEPGPEEGCLTCLPPLAGSHESPRRDPDGSMESRLPGRSNLPEKPSITARNRQTRILTKAENPLPIRHLAILHGRLMSLRHEAGHLEAGPGGSKKGLCS